MHKEIGTFKFTKKVPEELKSIVRDSALAVRFNNGWDARLFLKISIEELLNSYANLSDHYVVGWDDEEELTFHFFKEEEPIAYGNVRMVLPKGMEFYQAHVGKDMFLGNIIRIMYENKSFTTKFKDKKKKKKEEEPSVDEATEEVSSL